MTKILIPNATVAYPDLFVAKENQKFPDGRKRYSAQVRLYDNDPATEAVVNKIRSSMQATAKEKWGVNAKRNFDAAMDSKNTRWLQHDPEGFYYMNVKRDEDKGAPTVLDRSRRPIQAADGKPRSGDVCNVIVDLWIYDNSNARGFSATLLGVQWVREGEVVIGKAEVATVDDFEELEPADDGFAGDDFNEDSFF